MGIETDKFVSPVEDEFTCPVCSLVLDNPVRLSGCEHMFCRECIEEWIGRNATCPVDRNQIDENHLIAPDRSVVSIMNKLKIKCEFEPMGCQDVVQLESWKNHLKKCEFNPANKQPCIGCGVMMMKREEASHKCVEKLEIETAKLMQENDEQKKLISDFQLANEKFEIEITKLKRESEEQKQLVKDCKNREERFQLEIGSLKHNVGQLNDFIQIQVDQNEEAQKTVKNLENEIAVLKNKNRVLSDCIKKLSTIISESKTLIDEDEPLTTRAEVNSRVDLTLEEKITTTTIDKWPILKQLPLELKNQVRLAFVSNTNCTNDAVFIVGNDETFWINDKKEFLKIDGLSGVRIKQLTLAGVFESATCVLAVTEDDRLFVWSLKGHSFLQRKEWGINPKLVSDSIGKTVIDVTCGDRHALALTVDGEVWSWGYNRCGQLGRESTDRFRPMKVIGEIGDRRTAAVACSLGSSFAVMDNGDLYSWGFNKYGELGIGNDVDQRTPTKIEAFAGVKIHRLACGIEHALAVTENGSMFAWGEGNNGQLGVGDKKDRSKPIKIGPDDVKFIEVAACHFTSVALSDDGRCWIWGKCRTGIVDGTEDVLLPKPVESASIHDAIADFAYGQKSWKTMVIRRQ